MIDLQTQVAEVFLDHFGRTPLTQRIDDIFRESLELRRFTDLRNLREEMGDLIASAIMGCEECDWNFEELVQASLEKIKRRGKQYRSLGRKTSVAVFGLAGDPATIGHLRSAQYILEASRAFDEVWLMPCFRHMHNKAMVAAEHRLEMCRLAAVNDGRIRVCDFEIANELSGETYQTVKRMLEVEGESHALSFVIGMDNANDFDTWVNYEELERLVPFVVIPRKGYTPKASWFYREPHIYLGDNENPIPEISSTEFRRLYASNDPAARDAVTPEVYDYIEQHGLYKEVAP